MDKGSIPKRRHRHRRVEDSEKEEEEEEEDEHKRIVFFRMSRQKCAVATLPILRNSQPIWSFFFLSPPPPTSSPPAQSAIFIFEN